MNRDDYYKSLCHSARGWQKKDAKYIDRKLVNGRWEYTYAEDRNPKSTDANGNSINNSRDLGRQQQNKAANAINNNSNEQAAREEASKGDNLGNNLQKARDIGRANMDSIANNPNKQKQIANRLNEYRESKAQENASNGDSSGKSIQESRDAGRAAQRAAQSAATKEAGKVYAQARAEGRSKTQAELLRKQAEKKAKESKDLGKYQERALTSTTPSSTLEPNELKKNEAELNKQRAAAAGRYSDEAKNQVETEKAALKESANTSRAKAKREAEYHQTQNHNLAQDQKIVDQKSAEEHAKKDVDDDIRRMKRESLNKSNQLNNLASDTEKAGTNKKLFTSEMNDTTQEKYYTTDTTKNRYISKSEDYKRQANSALFQEQKKAEEERLANRSTLEKGRDFLKDKTSKAGKAVKENAPKVADKVKDTAGDLAKDTSNYAKENAPKVAAKAKKYASKGTDAVKNKVSDIVNRRRKKK